MAKGFITKFLKKPNGEFIFLRFWKGAKEGPVLILLHDMGSHSLRFEPLAQVFQKLGYNIYAFDFSGFGKSQTFKGHIENFNVYVNEVLAMAKLAQMEFPKNTKFIIGEGMGGTAAVHYARYYQETLQGLILLSPAVKFRIHIPVERTLKALFNALFNKYIPYEIPVTKEMLTREFKMQKKLQTDELNIKSVTTEFYLELQDAMNKMNRMAAEIRIPVYLLQAAEDLVIDAGSVRAFFNILDSRHKELILLERFYHSLSIDKDKEFVFQLIHSWIDKLLFVMAGPQVA